MPVLTELYTLMRRGRPVSRFGDLLSLLAGLRTCNPAERCRDRTTGTEETLHPPEAQHMPIRAGTRLVPKIKLRIQRNWIARRLRLVKGLVVASNLRAMASSLRAMASNLIAMASNLRAMASNLRAMASNLRAMASNLRAMASNLGAMASNLRAMASNLRAMASNLIAIASNLIAMASNPRATASSLIY